MKTTIHSITAADVTMTAAARANVEETGANILGDVRRVYRAARVGLTAAEMCAVILRECLDGADDDRAQGWADYVDAVADAAAACRA